MCGATRLMSRGAHVTDHTDLIRAPGEVYRAVCGATRLMSRGAHVTDHTDLIRAPGEVNRAVCVCVERLVSCREVLMSQTTG